MPPGTLAMVRSLPLSETARRLFALPVLEALNQISSPFGDQTTPSTEDHPEESFFTCPCRSRTETEPRSSPIGFSWSPNAICLPSGDIFGWLIQLIPSSRTL